MNGLIITSGQDYTEAERGDVEALAGLLARAIDMHGFGKYRNQQAGVIAATSEEAQQMPAESMSWRHLAAVEIESGEAASLRAWEAVKQAAREELNSGHRAASVMESGKSTPMERARFLILRESLAAEWQPVNGIERLLIDQMTQAATAQLYWMATLTERTQQEAAEDLRDRQRLEGQQRQSEEECRREQLYRWGEWIPSRITTSEAIAEAMGMVDRWNRIYLRTLRQLRDLRRYNVVIQNAGQVNVGEKQINLASQSGNKQEPVKKMRAKRRRWRG